MIAFQCCASIPSGSSSMQNKRENAHTFLGKLAIQNTLFHPVFSWMSSNLLPFPLAWRACITRVMFGWHDERAVC